MFLEAQRRFQRDQGRTSNYVRDILQTYGNRGEKINLPKQDDGRFQEALNFRLREKQKIAQLQHELHETKTSLEQERQLAGKFARYITSLPQKIPDNNVADVSGGNNSRSHDNTHSRHVVLPSKDDTDANDTHDGAAEEIISRQFATDEPAATRRRGARANDAGINKVDEAESEASSQRPDAGGALPDAPDRAKSDVGGQGGEHDSAE